MPDTVSRKPSVGQQIQHSPPTTTDGVPAGKKSRTTSPLPMDQDTLTKLPMPLLFEGEGKGDKLSEDMDIEAEAGVNDTPSMTNGVHKLVEIDHSSSHTPQSSPDRTPHETSSEGLFDELSPVQSEGMDDRSSSLEPETGFCMVTRERRDSFELISSPESLSDVEKTVQVQPSSSDTSENGFVMIANRPSTATSSLPKTTVSNDTLVFLNNLSVKSPVPEASAENELDASIKTMHVEDEANQDVVLNIERIEFIHENCDNKVLVSTTLTALTWAEYFCTNRKFCLRFKSSEASRHRDHALGVQPEVDNNTIFRVDSRELWGEILPAEATVIEVIGGSKAIIVLTKAADNEGLWPQLFAPQQVRIASEATTGFGEFERNSEDLDVRLKSLNYDWNEDPKERMEGLYLNFRLRSPTLISLQFARQRFLLRFKTSDPGFLLRHASKVDGEWVPPNEDIVIRYESAPLFAPIDPEACKEVVITDQLPRSGADNGIQIFLAKKDRKFWHDLYLTPPADPVTRNKELENTPAKPSASLQTPPRSHRPQIGQVSSMTGEDSDENEQPENINSLYKENDNGWLHQSRSGFGRSNGWVGSSLHSHESVDDLRDPYQPHVSTGKYYGMTGLNNLGNSCYLNAVMQCLANTRELRDYFIKGHYKKEINLKNPLGSKGKFAKVMDFTLASLWSGDRSSFSPSALREIMADTNDQFSTRGQQDAQEAMACIMDNLHEDLNRVTVKPYLADIESDGKSDEELAKHTWDYLLSRENSAIHDLFTGMFKSTVECRKCQKQNIKFDAYQCVSVPVPRHGIVIECRFYPLDIQKPIKKFRVAFNKDHMFAQDSRQLQAFLGDVPLGNTELLAVSGAPEYMKVQTLSFSKAGDFPCNKLDENMRFLIFEVLTEDTAKDPVYNLIVKQYLRLPRDSIYHRTRCNCPGCSITVEKKKRCTKCYSVTYCSKECQTKDWTAHKNNCNYAHGPAVGLPFIISLRESHLKKTNFFIHAAKSALKSVSVLQGQKTPSRPLSTAGTDSPGLSEPSSSSSSEPLSPSPMDTTMTEHSEPASPSPQRERTNTPCDGLSDSDSGVGSSMSVNHEAEMTLWDMKETAKESMKTNSTTVWPFAILPDGADERVKVASAPLPSWKGEMDDNERAINNLKKKTRFNLVWDDTPNAPPCRVEERVLDAVEDETCHSLKNERERRFSVTNDEFTLSDCVQMLTEPEVLDQSNAWMCPACKKPQEAVKKFEIWSLPTVLVFQLKRFSKPSGEVWRRDKIESLVEISPELDMQKFIVGPGDGGNYMYDLYGVVNHRGSTWFGHYVAYTRCYDVPATQHDEIQWRSFDDEYVQPETRLDGIQSSAYLLFYRRRGTNNPIHLPVSTDESSETDSDDAAQG